MILLFKDWLKLAEERGNVIIFAIVVLSLLFPGTIRAKNPEKQLKLIIEDEITIDHENKEESGNGSASKQPKKKPKKAEKHEGKKPKAINSYYITATAYTSTPDQCWGNPFITASGKRVYDGLIAANGLKFGTKVRFPEVFGDKIFTVDDRMSSRYGTSRVDIWMDGPRSKALIFGKKYMKMEILES